MNPMKNPYLFIIYFVMMWFAVLLILSYWSGWSELAQNYPYQGQPILKKKHFQWLNMRGVSYKGCITIGGNEQGLYISVMYLFSFGAPSLFIPWQDISIVKKKYWWFPVLELSSVKAPSIKIRIFQSLESFLQDVKIGTH
jgi:hypothetical protein